MPHRTETHEPRAEAHASQDDAWAARVSAAIAAGSREALATLYESRFAMLLETVRRATRCDESFALDCVQDAMIRVATRLGRIETVAALDAWLRRVTINAAIDRLRNERSRLDALRAITTDGQSAAFDPIVELSRELARLPHEERSLLSLRFVRGLTLEQLAEHLGQAPKAIDSRIRRTLARLRGANPIPEREQRS